MFDFIIVGQGLAGSVMAYTLLKRGCRVMVLDTKTKPTASSVAAGLYNPITGRKMVKTWMADTLFPFLEKFYAQAAQDINMQVLHPMPIYRPFINIEEQNDWMGKTSNNTFDFFVQQVARESIYGNDIYDPYGGLVLQHCGYLDTVSLMAGIRKMLIRQQSYYEEVFDHDKLIVENTQVCYHNFKAKFIIFCEGAAGTQNPFFNWLPFCPVKGEILLIETARQIERIYNRGVFVLPAGKYCRVGSTYHHQELNQEPTEAAREQLCEKLNILLKTQYKIINQVAGIRPATQDRRPFAGIHPTLKPLAIFNGLGTKGVSLAPYFAHELANFLLQGTDLSTEVDISRYFQLHTRGIA